MHYNRGMKVSQKILNSNSYKSRMKTIKNTTSSSASLNTLRINFLDALSLYSSAPSGRGELKTIVKKLNQLIRNKSNDNK